MKRIFEPGVPIFDEMIPFTHSFSPSALRIARGKLRHEYGKFASAVSNMRSNLSMGFS